MGRCLRNNKKFEEKIKCRVRKFCMLFLGKKECHCFYKIKENLEYFTVYDDGLNSIKHFIKNGISEQTLLKIKRDFIDQLTVSYHKTLFGKIGFKILNNEEFISKARKKLKGKTTISLDQLYTCDYSISLVGSLK